MKAEKQANGVFALISFLVYQTWVQIKRHKASYALGVCACVVVVIVIADLLTVIGNAPIIYMRIAELSASENDISFTPIDGHSSGALNYTLLSQILSIEDRFTYHSPRFTFSDGLIFHCSPSDASLSITPGANWMYHGFPVAGEEDEDCSSQNSCFEKYCNFGTQSTSSDFLVADTLKEQRMELGRKWALPSLDYGKAQISQPLSKKLNANIGDTFVVQFSPSSDISWLWSKAHTEKDIASNTTAPKGWYNSIIYLPLIVDGIYDDSYGRIESSLEKGIIVEFNSFGQLLSKAIDPSDTRARSFFSQKNLSEYSQNILVNLPPSRSTAYIQSNMDDVLKTITSFASEVIYRSGFNNLAISLPVMEDLYPFRFVALFLSLIINLSIIVLLFLCIILIYSLLMINVETRTFEVGVFRMIGSSRRGLVELLLTQALFYAFPSWIIGLCFAQALAVGVFKAIESVAEVAIPNLLTGRAIGVATALGFAVPIIASILPIRNALKQNLSMSLDTRRSKATAVKIKVERSETASISWTLLLIGLFMAIFGLGVYIIFPSSLLTFDLALLLNLFFVLILLMLVGLVLLSLNLENILYRLVAVVFFFWDHIAIRTILIKNLIAHKMRNRKTTIMYSVSLSFIIFMYVAYSMQVLSFQYQTKQERGTELGLYIEGTKSSGAPYVITINSELEEYAKSNQLIKSYTWATIDLSLITKSTYTASNIGRIYENTLHIYGISPKFNDIVFDTFMNFGDRLIDSDLAENITLSNQLYTKQGSMGLVLGTYLMTSLGITPGDHFLLNEYPTSAGSDSGSTATSTSGSSQVPPIRKKSFAFMTTSTCFSFSKFPSVATQDALVSIPQYISLSRGVISSADNLPLGTFYVELHPNVSDSDYATIKQDLIDIAALQSDKSPSIWDLRKELTSMDVATKITNYFFLFTTVIAMVTSFFSLSSSMLANVFEQTKEIGVLRALGLTKPFIRRLYVYEAFVIVFSSSLMGIIIGTLIGWTMTLQRVLFTQMPLGFVFPWEILILVFGLSIIFAGISSYGPIADLMSKPIVQVMRILT